MNTMVLPVPVKIKLTELGVADDVKVAVAADLTRDNKYGQEWLVATTEKLFILSTQDDIVELLATYPLADIQKVRTVGLVGSGMVQIETHGQTHRLVSYSNAKSAEFNWAVEDIDNLIKKNVPEQGHPDRTKHICAICGLPLPPELNKCPRCAEKGKTFRRILQFSRPYAKQIFLLFLTILAGTGVGLVIPYMSKLFIDTILKPDPVSGIFAHAHWLLPAALVFLAAHVCQLVFSSLQERLAGVMGYYTVFDVRAAVYEKLQELSLSYFDRHQTGAILARVNQDTAELQRFMVDFIPLLAESLLTLIGVGVFLFILSWKLTIFVLIPISGIIFYVQRIMPRIRVTFSRFFHRRARLSALVNDSLSGIRVIKSFGQEDEEIKKFDRSSGQYRDAGVEVAVKWALYHPIFHFFILLGSVLVWYIGGKFVVGGSMTVGSVVAYSGYLMMFYRPISTLTRMIQWITNSLIAAERVFDVIDTEPEIQDSPAAAAKPRLDGKIEFKDVTFGYNRFKPVIKDMNFTIQPNEIVGLVGKSGAGKSTIINLFCRLYDVNRGAILIDGVDVRQIRYADLRRQIGVVLQETFLFNGSIFENIAYARPEATREEVIAAAITANAHEFIMRKPDGYDTEVGERGNSLSGGEKQRISIARAVLRNPRILILDEATSSVDAETEKKIQAALEKLMQGRTTITIAHRLSTLRNCHRLFVIDEGKLVEEGTHAELLARQGHFSKLVDIQQELSRIIAVDG